MKNFASRPPATKVLTSEPGKGPALVDNRAAAVAQRKMQETIANSPRQAAQSQPAQPPAPRPSRTGLPDKLKAGVESLAGYSLGDVQVHYNSAKPAQLQAHAYAQGTAIHLAPGQEQHLPHEAWHVVQQQQGRVRPTMQLKGKVAVNDDAGLEREADVMGARASSLGISVETPRGVDTLSNVSVGAATVQRELCNEQYDETHPSRKKAAQEFFERFDAKTDEAFKYAISVPTLGPLANLNGYTQLWVNKWTELMAGGAPKLLAATFGYVVESLVSAENSPFRPTAPAQCRILTQVAVGGTRPDVVLVAASDAAHIAWLDLTASGSVDHIFNKDDWSKKISMYAEVTYPSLDPGYIALMRQNKDNTGPIDPKVFAARLAAAAEAYRLKEAQWVALGRNYQISNLRSQIPASRDSIGLDPSILRNFIRQRLIADFKATEGEGLTDKMVPSVLKALHVNSAAWGYNAGYTENKKAGESWLIDNDSALVPAAELPDVVMAD